MTRNQVYILSDEIRTGKTTTINNWAKKMPSVTGFLSPDINGKRQFQDIETGCLIPMETEQKDLIVGKYSFDKSSFKKVEKAILKVWNAAESNFIVLDEIGPLEINKDLGFHKLLIQLQKENQSDKPNLLFVVRSYCLENFLKKYTFSNIHILSLTEFKNSFNHRE